MRQLVKEKENSEFKTVKLRLKIDLVSYPARAEGLDKYVYIYIYIRVRVYIYMYIHIYFFKHAVMGTPLSTHTSDVSIFVFMSALKIGNDATRQFLSSIFFTRPQNF